MSLKLIGAGFGRTGTLSLKLALEQIGYGPCYHMTEVMLEPENAAHWMRAVNGNPDWDATFKGYVSTVDFPGCTFWRELSQVYPEAKVLLSVRNPQTWFESTQATIFSEMAIRAISQSPMGQFLEKTVWNTFANRIHDRDFMIETFERHNAEVVRTIPAERLLVYEASQGWEPLCTFLNVPVPETPFPRANSREEMATFMRSNQGEFDPARIREHLKARLGRS